MGKSVGGLCSAAASLTMMADASIGLVVSFELSGFALFKVSIERLEHLSLFLPRQESTRHFA